MPPLSWQDRYATDEYVYGTAPNEFLVSQAHRLKTGQTCLAVADGEGRNGVWLAQQGLDVHSVDGAASGLAKAQKLAQSRKVTLRTEQADLLTWDWPVAAYDLVATLFVHFPSDQRPTVHRAMADALKPGGLLIMEVFHPDQLTYKTGGPPVADMLYAAETLRADFAGLDIEILEECLTELSEGPLHYGKAAVTRLVATKP
ncbi:bifunctional 2-polyprenyl-6-hydroxyphenol methylase/3-demethylubiquinol 3-O-methyltransferase UbiG [Magnetospira sp. QH-2]|uniref:class I SAM-dependent methyltransferase n=1 Tax=Magnetospira sp. (strain QH-2) TaxID=1288970 RepID=UPI0003E80D90|nr:class I SAM-dependent methyltransferase [Magnetospira sp. QH-2]CCQ74451.1 putative Tellurite resistance protein TehB [Magnetospira sp. QH-2]